MPLPKFSFWSVSRRRTTFPSVLRGISIGLYFGAATLSAETNVASAFQELTDPTARSMGGISAVPTLGASAMDNNPAAMFGADSTAFRAVFLRSPNGEFNVLTTDENGVPRARETLTSNGYGLQFVRQSLSLGAATRVGLEGGFRQSGRFSRVGTDGSASLSFPETDWLVGGTLAHRVSRHLAIGGGAKWIRSKVPAASEADGSGSGWAFDAGLYHRPTRRWEFGLVARNLTGGLSFAEASQAGTPQREILAGVGRLHPLSKSTWLDIAGDVRLPVKHGLRFTGGGTLIWRNRAGIGVGYQRLAQDRTTQRLNHATTRVSRDERLWTAQGVTLGAWMRLSDWEVSVAASPAFRPLIAENERLDWDASRWQWSVGLARGR